MTKVRSFESSECGMPKVRSKCEVRFVICEQRISNNEQGIKNNQLP